MFARNQLSRVAGDGLWVNHMWKSLGGGLNTVSYDFWSSFVIPAAVLLALQGTQIKQKG